MTESRFSSTTIGQVAIATGILGFLEFPLELLAVIGLGDLDVFMILNAILGIINGIIALMLYTEHYNNSKFAGGIVAALAVVSSVTIIIGAVRNSVNQDWDYELIEAGYSLESVS